MTELVLAALFLPVSHFGISSSRLRAILVARLGEQPYRGLYSLITVIAFTWLVVAYRHAPTTVLWTAPGFVKLAMLPIVFLGFLLVVIGGATPNPTVVGAEGLFDRPDVVRGILRVTRNPFLWGVGLWALAHVVATGDFANLILFLSIGSLGLIGTALLDWKKARRHGARWEQFARVTSSVPFLAIAQGRQRLVLSEIGAWRFALAIGLFVVVLLLHQRFFGVSPLAGV